MGRKLGLSREDVIAAAVRIADRQGAEAVTLASVAARLGVRSPSLYNHIEGLEELRRALALEAAGRMATALRKAVPDHRGLDALRPLARAYRTFATEHPGLYNAAQRAVQPGEDDELYRALAAVAMPVIQALGEAGVKPDERVHLTRAFRASLHGFVVLEQLGGFGMPESVDESFDRLVDLLIAGVDGTASSRISG